jgi:hypothetical protein
VKYEPAIPDPVRRWTAALYRSCFDNWPAVRDQLENYPMTGSFKIRGRFRSHRELSDWHYSGTFFWMRQMEVFSRERARVPQFYGGVEAWPGMLFQSHQTGCLFFDNLKGPPYSESFWATVGNRALRQWEQQTIPLVPPSDLEHMAPIDGYEWPRTEQKPDELNWWLEELIRSGARRILSLGAMHCGVEWHTARRFREHGRDVELTAVDSCTRSEAVRTARDLRERFGQRIQLIEASTSSTQLPRQLEDTYDAVFIDAGHGYRDVYRDWRLACSRQPNLIGLHDIVDSDWHAQMKCSVSRLWDELSQQFDTEKRCSGQWGGIGIVRLRGNEGPASLL